jgi:gluconolactonase
MKKLSLFTATFMLFTTMGMTQTSNSPVIADGAKLIRLSDKYSFTEGPAVDKNGDVYFTDQPNNKIIKWSATDNSLSVYMDDAGRSNGTFFDKKGNLITCADLNNQLWLIDKNKKVTALVKDYNGKLLNGPNDLWIDNKGGIYITDPLYVRNYWTRSPEMQQDARCVYYLKPDKKELIRVADQLVQPNGIIGTPDNKFLYVADIMDQKVYRYDIQKDGSLTNRFLFANINSDGMTIDNKGNIYTCNADGVNVFNPKGEKIELIPTGEKWTANVTFGGKKRDKLFITASTSVFIIDMKVKGVN